MTLYQSDIAAVDFSDVMSQIDQNRLLEPIHSDTMEVFTYSDNTVRVTTIHPHAQ